MYENPEYAQFLPPVGGYCSCLGSRCSEPPLACFPCCAVAPTPGHRDPPLIRLSQVHCASPKGRPPSLISGSAASSTGLHRVNVSGKHRRPGRLELMQHLFPWLSVEQGQLCATKQLV